MQIDAHQHFWDPIANDIPWLRAETPIPFRYGDYQALRRPYLPPAYRRDAGRHRIVKTVYVETEWTPADPIGETRDVRVRLAPEARQRPSDLASLPVSVPTATGTTTLPLGQVARITTELAPGQIDHLDGILYIDHLSPLKRGLLLARYRKENRGDGYIKVLKPTTAGG